MKLIIAGGAKFTDTTPWEDPEWQEVVNHCANLLKEEIDKQILEDVLKDARNVQYSKT